MKRVITGIALGAAAGIGGVIAYELSNLSIVGWLTAAVLLGIVSQLTPSATGRWPWWGGLGGGIILLCWAVNTVKPVPIWVAWPLLGAVLGCLSARNGLGWRIAGGAIGLLAAGIGMGILPLITLVCLPALGLPTTFDYDVDVLGLVTAGGFIGGTIAWLKGEKGKIAKKSKRRIPSRGKKR
jgi:apolipoprotein N-acyltransferase